VLHGVNNGIAENIAQELECLFPSIEYHSALVIAEAAVVDSIDLLITWDAQLLKLDAGRLALFLKDRGYRPITIVSPDQVISVLKKKR
jgi:DNA-binding GntR family transcriptional regulator